MLLRWVRQVWAAHVVSFLGTERQLIQHAEPRSQCSLKSFGLPTAKLLLNILRADRGQNMEEGNDGTMNIGGSSQGASGLAA